MLLDRFVAGWRALLGRQRVERELRDELDDYIEIAAQEKMRRGMPREAAVRAARVELGGAEAVKEEVRGVGWESFVYSLLTDTRYGARLLRRSPGFTVIAVLTLALGIGVNATIFSAFDAVTLRPLPVPDGSELLRLERWVKSNLHGSSQYAFSWGEYVHLRDQQTAFSGLIAASFPARIAAALPGSDGRSAAPENVLLQLVSANYFSHLRVNPISGRGFRDGDAQEMAVVISHPFWQRRWFGDTSVVGRTVRINGADLTIIGIAPADFIGTANPPVVPDVWAPLALQPQLLPGRDWLTDPTDHEVQLLGRLAHGNQQQAQAEMELLLQQFDGQHEQTDPTLRVTLQLATLFGNTEDPRFQLIIALIMAVVGLVLLVACANLANMLLARGAARQREIGMRIALGARRLRLVRQLMTESLLLALLGGAAGLLVSVWGSRLVWLAAAPFIGSGFAIPTAPDGRIFIYALLVSLATAVLFGLWPALRSSRADINAALKDAGFAASQPAGHTRLRTTLVALQTGVCVVFLMSAGLLLRGLLRAESAEPGFETATIYAMGMEFNHDNAKANDLAQRVIARMRTLPEVQALALSQSIPLVNTWTVTVTPLGTTARPQDVPCCTLMNRVSSEYFGTMGIPLVRGRNLERADESASSTVAVVSEATARAFWPGADPLGKHVKLALNARLNQWGEFEVVGVVKDVRTANLSRADPAFVYIATNPAELHNYVLLVRTRGEERRAWSAIGAALQPLDARFGTLYAPLSLRDWALAGQRLMVRSLALSAALLATLALLLAAIGVYGVTSYLVGQREREIGIRMALGARSVDVLRLVLRQGMRPVLFGGAFGMLGAFGVSAILRALLVFPGSTDFSFGVGHFDPVTFIGLSVFLAGVAALACLVPARRAVRVHPMVALRHE